MTLFVGLGPPLLTIKNNCVFRQFSRMTASSLLLFWQTDKCSTCAQCPAALLAFVLPWGDPFGCYAYSSTIKRNFFFFITPCIELFLFYSNMSCRRKELAICIFITRIVAFFSHLNFNALYGYFIRTWSNSSKQWRTPLVSLFTAPSGMSYMHVSGLTRVNQQRWSYGR